MTYVYSPYTSLEDAWGLTEMEPIEKKKKQKKPKVHQPKRNPSNRGGLPDDPLCELYGNRYKKLRKPFYTKDSDMLENEIFNKVHSYKEDEDNRLYYGYKDEKPKRRNNKDQRCVSTHNDVEVYKPKHKKKAYDVDPHDDDDLYLQAAIASRSKMHGNKKEDDSFKKIYDNVYEDTDDEYVHDEEEECVYREEPETITQNVTHEETDDIVHDCALRKSLAEMIEEELKNSAYLKTLHNHEESNKLNESNVFVDERQHLDMLLYVFSGIILIFVMEQFIQIGIRIKSPLLTGVKGPIYSY